MNTKKARPILSDGAGDRPSPLARAGLIVLAAVTGAVVGPGLSIDTGLHPAHGIIVGAAFLALGMWWATR